MRDRHLNQGAEAPGSLRKIVTVDDDIYIYNMYIYIYIYNMYICIYIYIYISCITL